jgi:hypothetical protein
MTKIADIKCMKHMLWLVLALCSISNAWAGIYQHGTVVRMRMGECLPARHGFMVSFGGAASPGVPEACPEYTLVSDKVVFVIVGNSADQLVPLADVVDFRLQKNELAMRLDDSRHETKFSIKEMILRSEWDTVQKHITDELNAPAHAADESVALRTRN